MQQAESATSTELDAFDINMLRDETLSLLDDPVHGKAANTMLMLLNTLDKREKKLAKLEKLLNQKGIVIPDDDC